MKRSLFEPTTREVKAEITNAAVRLLIEAETAIEDTRIRWLRTSRLKRVANPENAKATMTPRKTVTRERAE